MPRLLESLLTKRLKPVIYQNVTKYQLGGVQGTRPQEHLYTMKMILDTFNSAKKPVWISLFDMKKYFDVQRADDATSTLVEKGLSGPLLRLYLAVTQKNVLQVATPVGMSEKFCLGPLTPQGSSYGALVSTINLDAALSTTMDLMSDSVAWMGPVQLRGLAFQDDIAKLSTSKFECQLAQEAIAETITSKQLMFNADKCVTMVAGTGKAADTARSSLNSAPITMAGGDIKQVACDKYLGDIISNVDCAKSAELTVDARLKSVAGPITEILALVTDTRSSFVGPVLTGLTLWNSIIVPKLLTNAAAWIHIIDKTVLKLENCQTMFSRRLLGLPRTAPAAGVLWETGLLPMKWRIVCEKLKLVQHLELRDPSTLAATLWGMEKLGKLDGLRGELEKWITLFSLPRPTKLLTRKQYNRALHRVVSAVSREEIRLVMSRSRKLQYLSARFQAAGPQLGMTNVEEIRFLTRCRLSCHFDFEGDFGCTTKCSCGSENTLAHVRRGCIEYSDLLPDDTEEYFGVETGAALYHKIIDRRKELRGRTSSRALPPPTTAPPAPPRALPACPRVPRDPS